MLKNDYYKYKKYKNKYFKLKYLNILTGGEYDHNKDIIYHILEVIDDASQEVMHIFIDENTIAKINKLNNIKIAQQIINIFKSNNEFIGKLDKLQLLILCIVCSIITGPTVFINIVIEFINSIINRNIPFVNEMFKVFIPCSNQSIQLMEQIINEIYKKFNPETKIDLGPLQILLILLNLFSFNLEASASNNINLNISDLKKLDIFKKYYNLTSLNINKLNTDIQVSFNKQYNKLHELIIDFDNALKSMLNEIHNNFSEVVKFNNKLKEDIEKHAIIIVNDTQKHATNIVNDTQKHAINFLSNTKNFLRIGGNAKILTTQFIILKNISVFDLIIHLLKIITSEFNIINCALVAIRLLLKLFKDNIDLLLNVFNLNNKSNDIKIIFDIYYNVIDSILCFLLLVNNISQVLINALKIIIYNYFGEELNGFSAIICNFIQSFFDTFVRQKCSSSFIDAKNVDIDKQTKINKQIELKKEEIKNQILLNHQLQTSQQLQSPPHLTSPQQSLLHLTSPSHLTSLPRFSSPPQQQRLTSPPQQQRLTSPPQQTP